MSYLYLSLAIVAEVVATSSLKASKEFTVLGPSLLVLAGYLMAFFWMTLALRTLPVGITYAIWSGVGIVLVTLFAAWRYGEVPDLVAVVGMAFIVVGVVIIQVFSRTAGQG
ncbi:MAG: DMT family transporter [bacterium]